LSIGASASARPLLCSWRPALPDRSGRKSGRSRSLQLGVDSRISATFMQHSSPEMPVRSGMRKAIMQCLSAWADSALVGEGTRKYCTMSGRNRGRCCTTYHLMQCLWSCGRGWMVVGLSTAIPCPGIVPDLLSWATCAHYEAKTRQTDARPMFSRCAISVAPSPSALSFSTCA
jgi:hypothetical protein